MTKKNKFLNIILFLFSNLLEFSTGFLGNLYHNKGGNFVQDSCRRENDLFQLYSNADDESELLYNNDFSSKRRKLFLSLISLGGNTFISQVSSASTDGFDSLGSSVISEDNNKVVLTTYSENFPVKYEDDSSSSPSSYTSCICKDDVEEQRIAVFERVAPSVVFIDTFAEQRDAFSTNV